jgi:predicted deacylase
MPRNGSHRVERMQMARLASGASVEATVHTYDGAGDGPTVYMQSAQHGFEVNGTEVLRRFHYDLDLDDLDGKIVVVPIANPITFDQATREARGDIDSKHRDLNRVWPGRETGTVHERIASTLWTLAYNADYAIDLHTMKYPEAAPYVLAVKDNETSEAMAEAFGGEVIIRTEIRGDPETFDVDSYRGMFRGAATLAGTPAITPELGHSRFISEDIVESGLSGVKNVLKYLDMLPGDPEPNGRSVEHSTRCPAKTTHSGLFRPDADITPGDDVGKGEHVGTLYDSTTYETLQRVTAPHDGVLLQVSTQATVTAGAQVATFAHGEHPDH